MSTNTTTNNNNTPSDYDFADSKQPKEANKCCEGLDQLDSICRQELEDERLWCHHDRTLAVCCLSYTGRVYAHHQNIFSSLVTTGTNARTPQPTSTFSTPKWAQTKQCTKYAVGPPSMLIIIIYVFLCLLTYYLIRSHCHPRSQCPALTIYYINVQISPNDALLDSGGLGQGLKEVLIIGSWKKLIFNLSIVVYVYYFS